MIKLLSYNLGKDRRRERGISGEMTFKLQASQMSIIKKKRKSLQDKENKLTDISEAEISLMPLRN